MKNPPPKPAATSTPQRRSLSHAMGPLPLPPRIGRPPALRVMKAAPASPARLSTAAPRALQVSKLAPSSGRPMGVAGRLGAFAATPLKSVQPPKRGKGRPS